MNPRKDPFAHIAPCPKGGHNAQVVQRMDDRLYCIRCRCYIVTKQLAA